MAFPIERNLQKLQDREIIGTQCDAAVDCWFTAGGKTMPRLCKLKGPQEEIITIQNISVMKEEQKFYAGIHAKKHWCKAEHNGVMMQFYLVFYPEECRWKIVI